LNGLPPILLAEDDDLDAELTQLALSGANLENPIVRVRDGVETLEFLRREGRFSETGTSSPVVILLDIKMPRMDGLDVLREVRADPALRRIPIVALTSSQVDSDRLRSWDLGVNAFVIKPVDRKQFQEAIRALGVFWALVNRGAEISAGKP
jgi:two-component system response regulator